MSSLHQEPLLVGGSEPVPGPRTTDSQARGTSRRPAEEKSASTVPTQRGETSQRSTGTGRHRADGRAVPASVATSVSAVTAAATTAARPTPFTRTPVEPVAVAPAVGVPVEAPADAVVASIADGAGSGVLRDRLPSIRKRPSLYLAAALVGALSVSAFTSGEPQAQATDTMSHSVSIAEELGISPEPSTAAADTQAVERLGALAVSRNERDAEQAAAAQAQAAADQAAVQAAAEAARPKALLPVDGARITSTFGQRWGTLHAGIDFAAPMDTPEKAVMDGIVLEAGPASGFGLAVYIQHENGDVIVYGHMDKILVQPGQVVKAGDVIALLGNRGQSTGPHLHLEVHVGGINGQKIDPLPWLRERGLPV